MMPRTPSHRTSRAPARTASRFGLSVGLTFTLTLSFLAVSLWLLPDNLFEALYVRSLYPALTVAADMLTSWTAIPLGLVLLPLGTGLLLWRALLPPRASSLAGRLARAALIAAALVAAYSLMWGVNYRRAPLAELLGLPQGTATAEQLDELAEELFAFVLAGAEADVRTEAALASVALEIERLSQRIDRPARVPRRVKNLPSGTLLRAGYAGMLFPFTLEPQVDGGLAPASRVAVGAHELAHVAGFASEADADLAAVLAGLAAEEEFARYATALSLLSRTLPALPAARRSELIERLPERALSDLAEARSRAAFYLRPTVAARITTIYDRLLRSQGSAGVISYGQAPRLAALALSHGLLPKRPGAPDP